METVSKDNNAGDDVNVQSIIEGDGGVYSWADDDADIKNRRMMAKRADGDVQSIIEGGGGVYRSGWLG